MINITINAETGAEARGALLELLGLTGQSSVQTIIASPGMIIVDDPKLEATGEQAKEFVAETTKKRRSKAEIEADKAAAVIENVQEAVEEQLKPTVDTTDNDVAETQLQDNKDQVTVTKEDLQKKAVELGRVGKKELCRAVLQKHGADSISTADKNPLKVELYATVLDEFNKL